MFKIKKFSSNFTISPLGSTSTECQNGFHIIKFDLIWACVILNLLIFVQKLAGNRKNEAGKRRRGREFFFAGYLFGGEWSLPGKVVHIAWQKEFWPTKKVSCANFTTANTHFLRLIHL